MYRTSSPSSPLIVSVAQNQIAAYDRRTGVPVWAYLSPTQFQLRDDIRLEIENDRLFFVHYRQLAGEGFFGGSNPTATLGCLDYLTGKEMWHHSFETGHANWSNASLLVTSEQIFIAYRSTLKAFARETGVELWTQNIVGAPTEGTKNSIALAVPGRAVQTDVRD
jgi:outer membrane protein assembly factor BamB